MKELTGTSPFGLLAGDAAFDPLEDGVRQRVRRFIETIPEEELRVALGRGRYERSDAGATGHRLILDGSVLKARIDRKATAISVLAAIGVRRHGQKILLAIRNMGGESTAAWRAFLGDLDARGLKAPEFVIVDGAPGLEAALAELWPEAPVQRCTVHKHRNLLAHAPKALHDELTEDYRDMVYAETKAEIEARRKVFLRKWRLKCPAVADSLEEAGDRLFTFTRLDPSQWKSARTTNAIERLHEEFRRRIKTQAVLPDAETAPMLFWALLASGQIVMRKVDGWQTLSRPLDPEALDLAAWRGEASPARSTPNRNLHHLHDATTRKCREHFREREAGA
jgi:putative transposase